MIKGKSTNQVQVARIPQLLRPSKQLPAVPTV